MEKNKFLFLVGVSLLLPAVSLAQLQTYGSAPSILSMVHGIEMAAGAIFGGVAVVCFVVAGILFLTAAGDATKLSQARSAVLWGFAGVIVGIAAFSIIALISSIIS